MDDELRTVIPPLSGEPRDSDPLPLASQQTSPLFEFFVPIEGGNVFIRVIALFRDDEPLGPSSGDAPTFEIRAGKLGRPHGQSEFTPVRPGSEDVPILGSDNVQVGSLRCEREPNDIFLITIADIVENSGPWKLRIRNNAPDSLRFLGFSSPRERDTRQPWMQLGGSHLDLRFTTTKSIEVRNWGTGPLIFEDEAGPIGDLDFGLTIESIPKRLDPHQKGVITFERDKVKRDGTITHLLHCNDIIERHAMLSLSVRSPPVGGGTSPPPPPPPFTSARPCMECDCPEFLGPPSAEKCKRFTCEHPRQSHPLPF